jgi:ABC-type multidrug transport system permease subunit
MRVLALIYKSWINMRRNWFRLFDVTLWPLILFFSLILFIRFIQTDQKVFAMVVLGVIGWRAVYHFQIEPAVEFMDEYWGRTMANTMATPIRMADLVFAGIFVGFMKFLIVLSLYLVLAYFLFSFIVPNVAVFLLAILILALAGFAIGLITLGFTMLYFEHAITFTYILPDLIVLLSGVYYPTSIFPEWLQNVIIVLPTYHGFEMLKSIVGYGTPNYIAAAICVGAWLVIGFLFLYFCYRKAKKTGRFARFN